MINYILTIDIGTTSTKAFAFLPDGKVISNYQKAYSTQYPTPGFAEQDPDQILSAVIESIKAIVSSMDTTYKLAALSFSSAMHSLMAVDTDGNPITQLIIWADNRSESQAAELKSSELGNKIYGTCGTPIHPMAPICKLLWMREVQPELFRHVHKFISIKEYIFFNFTNKYAVDYSIASATGLFDTENLNWFDRALAVCGISKDQLSTPYSPEYIFFPLQEVALLLNIATNTPLIIGASDGCLANVGSHATNPGEMSITIGTSGAVRMAVNQFKMDALQRTFCYFLAEDTFIIGGASNNGAFLLNWFSENLLQSSETPEAFLASAFSASSTEGLIFLPYLMGERAPIYDAHATGAYVGIGIKHRQRHFRRAIIEGICFEIKSIIESVEEVVMPANKVFVSGGFIKSDLWVQLLCDVIGKPLSVDSNTDASSVGAAILAFKALHINSNFQTQSAKIFYPDEVRNKDYVRTYLVFKSLYIALKDEFRKIKNF